ncbi:Uncharacterised protein [Bordetella pertussis]|nr:Uncharacterised protein [Bordetella pertussis]
MMISSQPSYRVGDRFSTGRAACAATDRRMKSVISSPCAPLMFLLASSHAARACRACCSASDRAARNG